MFLQFANGKLGDLQTNVSLRSYHALEMGINAKVTNHLAFGVEWIELALSKADEEDDIRPDFRAKINQELTKAVAEVRNFYFIDQLINFNCLKLLYFSMT